MKTYKITESKIKAFGLNVDIPEAHSKIGLFKQSLSKMTMHSEPRGTEPRESIPEDSTSSLLTNLASKDPAVLEALNNFHLESQKSGAAGYGNSRNDHAFEPILPGYIVCRKCGSSSHTHVRKSAFSRYKPKFKTNLNFF